MSLVTTSLSEADSFIHKHTKVRVMRICGKWVIRGEK